MVLLKKQWRIISLAAALTATAAIAVFITIMMAGCADKPNNPATPDNGGNTDNSSGGNDGVVGIIDYGSVKIGGNKWMQKNLNIETEGSWCYDDNLFNCVKYGRLYTWDAAKKACPKGWHLPTRKDWGELAWAAGGYDDYGKYGGGAVKLQSKTGWNDNGNGTDDFKFSALPGGFRESDGGFYDVGDIGYWWTATDVDDGHWVYYRCMSAEYGNVGEDIVNLRWPNYGFSVRCVADK